MPNKISVLLVDDHSLVRRGFRRMLEDEPDIAVAGEAGDGEEAIRLSEQLRPRVILMDCALPGMSGLDATRRILEKLPDTIVLMLSMHPEETLVRQALDAVQWIGRIQRHLDDPDTALVDRLADRFGVIRSDAANDGDQRAFVQILVQQLFCGSPSRSYASIWGRREQNSMRTSETLSKRGCQERSSRRLMQSALSATTQCILARSTFGTMWTLR